MDDLHKQIEPRDHAKDTHYGETLLCDFAKFTTTLTLLVLGGMLTLSSAAREGDIKLFNLIFVSGAVAVAGVLAFAVANALADARSKGRDPPDALPVLMKIATGLLGLGVGGFLMMWMDTLS